MAIKGSIILLVFCALIGALITFIIMSNKEEEEWDIVPEDDTNKYRCYYKECEDDDK